VTPTDYGNFDRCARCQRVPTSAEEVVWPELHDGIKTTGTSARTA
jgi:hypothetical protein